MTTECSYVYGLQFLVTTSGHIRQQFRSGVHGILFMVPTSWSDLTTEALLCSGDTVYGAHRLV